MSQDVTAQVLSLDRFEAEQARLKKLVEGKPKAYEDNVMEPAALPANLSNNDNETLKPDELGARSVAIETRFGNTQSDGNGIALRASEWGVRTEYRRETINYGEWVLRADTSSRSSNTAINNGFAGLASSPNGSKITLRNLSFPVTASTFADTSLGDIASEVTDALARSYRFSLGTSTLRGISTRVFGREFDFRAGIGARGALTGGPYPGFEVRPGAVAWAGYTQRLSDQLFAGIQFNHAVHPYETLNTTFNPGSTGAQNGTINSVAAAVGYGNDLREDGDKKARLTLLRSQTTNASGSLPQSASGVFFEGGLRAGKFRHEMGLYASSPNLLFGDAALSSDNRGAYWRVDHTDTRLNWGAGLEYEQGNPGQDPTRPESRRTGVSANLQYRQNRDTSYGGSFNVTQTNYSGLAAVGMSGQGSASRSINASAFYAARLSNWGRSRITITARRNQTLVANDVAATGEELQWEHDWITRKYETQRPEFSTTLGYARDQSGGQLQTYPTAGIVFRYWTSSGYSIGGNLRYTSRNGNLSTSRGLAGGLTSEYSLGGGWRIGGALSLNQAVIQTAASGLVLPQLIRSNDKSVSMYLRWEQTTGAPFQSAGLRNPDAAGAGSISGVIYFDGNRDGERQLDEGGASNIEVILDQRYRVVTDKDGRFEFPLVSTGKHQLSLKLETIPLPWGLATEESTLINVPLRGIATTAIAVVRVGQ